MVGLWAGQTAGRLHHRAFAHHQRGPAPHQPQPTLHGGHRHRGLHLPAGAVRPPGAPPLPRLREGRAALTSPCTRMGELSQRRSTNSAPDETFPCPHCGAPVPELGMANFSFNKPAGACPTCTGLGAVHQADLARLVDESKEHLPKAPSPAGTPFHINYYSQHPAGRRRLLRLRLRPRRAGQGLHPGRSATCCSTAWTAPSSAATSRRRAAGHRPPGALRRRGHQPAAPLRRAHPANADYRDKLDEFLVTQTCPDCAGTRLRPESRAVTVGGQTIVSSRAPAARRPGRLAGAVCRRSQRR